MLSPDEALESFFLPPDYNVKLVGNEPLVVDPVTMDFDADGRLWIVEMHSYCQPSMRREKKTQLGK